MKQYSIISLILIAITGLFTYMNTNVSTTFSFFGVNITLLNAVWTMVFLSIFYLISIIYFSIEKYKNFKLNQNIKKDKNNLIKNIENRTLFKEKLYPIVELKEFEEFVEMIKGLEIIPKKSETFPFMEDILKLKNNEIVDLTKYKLDNNNPWVLKNLENKILNGDTQAAKTALNSPLKEQAIKLLAQKSSINEILNNNYPITKEVILNHLKDKEIKKLIDKSNLSNKEYIEIAQKLHQTYENPDFVLKIFENKIIGYIYLLIEYEMIDKAFELTKENGIKFFEYYLLLRQNGIKIDIKDYINATI